ncbi:CBS domain-containing protein [Roseiconus nitratireducens]|uniref:CBS domain-containing protein n=1 Tax=Roseiconus nitratireducens TaxID=2605748 RepID=A0A5M6D7L3_9BACT|nr:CBS domain-containing protein [Roseiconus nitratireducens]KAA5541849.1 CBS domain-containing protein [Roseiconus nitratireducens]
MSTKQTMSTKELTAVDVMSSAVRTVPSDMTLPDLEKELIREKVSGFPVVDQGKLVGVVSRADVVRQICAERSVAEYVSDFHFDETGFFEDKMESFKDIADRVGERIESLKVGDVMIKDPLTVPTGMPVERVAKQFMEHRVHRFPVTDHGDLVGIVTTSDLVRLIADRRLVTS